MYSENNDLIPLIWQLDGPDPSPGAFERQTFYNENYPFTVFRGIEKPMMFGEPMANFEEVYQQLNGMESSISLNSSVSYNYDNIMINTEITPDSTIADHNWQLVCLVINWSDDNYAGTVLEMTNIEVSNIESGISQNCEFSIVPEREWLLRQLRFVVMLQSWDDYPGTGQHEVLQAEMVDWQDVIPLAKSDICEGPVSLGVQFRSISIHQSGEYNIYWDFNNDGIWDAEGEEAYFLYEEEGSYDLAMQIEEDGVTISHVFEDYINVSDTEEITGEVTGVWSPEKGVYELAGEVIIPDGSELHISPGTIINCLSGSAIQVSGRINAAGRETDMITIGSESSWHGIYLLQADSLNSFEWCEIYSADDSGIKVDSARVLIDHCQIYNNSADTGGAGIDLFQCPEFIISDNLICNNYSDTGAGGINCSYSMGTMIKNIIVNNEGETAGGISVRNDSETEIINNTISHNMAVYCAVLVFNASAQVMNSIIRDDVSSVGNVLSEVSIDFCCLNETVSGSGNLNCDPQFDNPSGLAGLAWDGRDADWSLSANSLCIDAGNPDESYNDEDGTRNDMGAFGGTTGSVQISEQEVLDPTSLIESVYPNPFNPVLNIKLVNDHRDHANNESYVRIYNLKGQLVKELQPLEPESNIYSWQGENRQGKKAASGLYLLRVETSEKTESRKIILIK